MVNSCSSSTLSGSVLCFNNLCHKFSVISLSNFFISCTELAPDQPLLRAWPSILMSRLSEALHTQGILKSLWTLWSQVLKQAMGDSVQESAIPPHTSVSKSPTSCCLLAGDIPSHNPSQKDYIFFLLSEQMWHTWVPVHDWSLKVLHRWKW